MQRRVAAALAVLLPALAWAQPPASTGEGFAARQQAALLELYPKWDAGTSSTGVAVKDQLQHARFLEARPWELDGRRGWIVLTETWLGEACHAATCPPDPVDLGLFELKEGKLQLLGAGRGVAKTGGTMKAALDGTARHFDRTSPLIGITEESGQGDAAQTILRLFHLHDTTLHTVFERRIRWHGPNEDNCAAIVLPDELDQPPYPLEVTDRCQPSGRSAIEIWRWKGDAYQLHGPASDVDAPPLSDEQ